MAALAVALPFAIQPLELMDNAMVISRAEAGCVIVTDAAAVQEFALVTVIV
jgi:hypothetical protein